MKVWEDGILGVKANLLSDDSKNYVAFYYNKEYRRTDLGAAGGEMLILVLDILIWNREH